MSGMFNSSKDTTGSQQSQTNPWTPAQSDLTGMLGQINTGMNNTGITGAENSALNTIGNNSNTWAGQYAPQIGANASAMLNGGGAMNQAGAVNQNYQNYQNQMNPLASNTNYDPMQTPGLGTQLQTIQSDVGNSVNSMFAGAGRDMSGANQQAYGRGVAQGEAPVITGQYNQNVQNQQGAANNLYNAGNTNASLLSGMQQQSNTNQQAGTQDATQALQAQNTGANASLQAEAARRGIPVQALGLLAQIGIPIAGLGGQSSGTYSQNQTSTPSIMSDIGQVGGLFSSGNGGTSAASGMLQGGAGLLSGLAAFSDRRLKEDIKQVGSMFDGTPVYRYRYIGCPGYQIGLMAQDIEKEIPEAVGEINGFKTVNYKIATERAVETGGC
jgi:hypothetical protein